MKTFQNYEPPRNPRGLRLGFKGDWQDIAVVYITPHGEDTTGEHLLHLELPRTRGSHRRQTVKLYTGISDGLLASAGFSAEAHDPHKTAIAILVGN